MGEPRARQSVREEHTHPAPRKMARLTTLLVLLLAVLAGHAAAGKVPAGPTKAPVEPVGPTKAPVEPAGPTKAPVEPAGPTKAPVEPPTKGPKY